MVSFSTSEAEFQEFEPRLKFKTRLKYGWFHFKLYSNVSRFRPALNWNRVLTDFRRGSNLLNSESEHLRLFINITELVVSQRKLVVFLKCKKLQFLKSRKKTKSIYQTKDVPPNEFPKRIEHIFYRKSKINIKRKHNYEKGWFHNWPNDQWSFHIDSMPFTLQTMIFRYNYKYNDFFIHLIHFITFI